MYAASATLESPLDSSKHIIAQLLCPVQRSLTQGFQLPHLCPQIRGSERNRLWQLKKSRFLKTAEILRIENVYENRDRRLWSFLLRSFFDDFLLNEFFNSHACYCQLTFR